MAAIQNLKILEGINKFVIILLFTSSVAHFVLADVCIATTPLPQQLVGSGFMIIW